MKTINEIISTTVRLERKSMRDCAIEYRQCAAKGDLAGAGVWLTFAIYHREAARSTASELLTGQTGMPPHLVRRVDALIRQGAEKL